jgi:hypothetical protein
MRFCYILVMLIAANTQASELVNIIRNQNASFADLCSLLFVMVPY